MSVYLSHVDDMFIGLVLLSAVEIALKMAGDILNMENQVLRVRFKVMLFHASFDNMSIYRGGFIGGGNRNTGRKPPIYCKSLYNFIGIRNHNFSGDLH
jgi:hypothetical protein